MCYFSNLYSHPDKFLEIHLKNVKNLALKFLDEIPIDKIPITKEKLAKLLKIITLSHDIGKSTKFFQKYLLEGEEQKDKKTRHSLLSSLIAYYITKKAFMNESLSETYKELLPIFAFLSVKRHHGNIEEVLIEVEISEEEKEILKAQIESIEEERFKVLIKNIEEPEFQELSKEKLIKILELVPKEIKSNKWTLRKLKNEKSIDYYLLNNLLFSILIDGDKSEVVIGEVERNPIEIPNMIVDNYKKTLKSERILINELREKAYQEVINKEIDLDQRLYSLNLPTGLGKTLTSLSFALKLREKLRKKRNYLPRIIYSLPFLTIIEQNAKVIEEVLKNCYPNVDTSVLLKHHHLSEIYYKYNEKEFEPDEAKILIEGWNSEIIITTFVQLFHTLVSNQNSSLRKLHNIFGSIIILDEIQSIPFKYWLLLREIFIGLVEKFNCYIIFSTATQPLIFKKEEMTPLVKGEDYFIKLNRTKINPSIEKPLNLETLVDRLNIDKDKSYLFILNTINSAKTFYNLLKEKFNEEIIFLSSHITPKERLERIEKVKTQNTRIMVSTQLVEAGVDIDFDIVYRDIAPLDSINQSAGRCNRNWKKDIGEVYVYSLRDEKRKYASYIYDTILLDVTEKILKKEETIEESKFLEYIYDYFKELNERKSNDISRNLLEAIYSLRYTGWAEKEEDRNIGISDFKLIEDAPKIDVFIELDEKARLLWQKYCELKEIKNLFERRLEFQKIKGEFYKYVISIPQNLENLPPIEYGFGYVSKDNLKDFYDLTTGYKAKSEVILW